MPVNSAEAKRLLTASEFELFRQSSQKEIKALPPARLKSKIQRTRRLRDKYRDLAKQQRGEARGKRDPKGVRPASDNQRTVRKVEIFDQVLQRYETRLAKVEEEKRKAAEKKLRDAERKSKAAEKKKLLAAKKKKAAEKKKLAEAAAKKKSSAAKSKGVGGAGGPAGAKAPLSANTRVSVRAKIGATRGHYSSSQRRSQGKRDSR